MEATHLNLDDAVDVREESGRIVIEPAQREEDQVKSLNWRQRRAKRKGITSAAELAEVRAKIRALIG